MHFTVLFRCLFIEMITIVASNYRVHFNDISFLHSRSETYWFRLSFDFETYTTLTTIYAKQRQSVHLSGNCSVYPDFVFKFVQHENWNEKEKRKKKIHIVYALPSNSAFNYTCFFSYFERAKNKKKILKKTIKSKHMQINRLVHHAYVMQKSRFLCSFSIIIFSFFSLCFFVFVLVFAFVFEEMKI